MPKFFIKSVPSKIVTNFLISTINCVTLKAKFFYLTQPCNANQITFKIFVNFGQFEKIASFYFVIFYHPAAMEQENKCKYYII